MTSKKIAFIFPGQGSQSLGMLAELAQAFSVVEQTYDQASQALNYDIWELTQQGPEALLNQTERTQPALLAGAIAVWRIWQNKYGAKPYLLAGHSLGEYAALVCAESLAFEDAINLVAARGRFMQEAVAESEGAMAAIIGLEDKIVGDLCSQVAAETKKIISPANFNALGQIVIAGETAAVEKVIILAKNAGAKIAKLIPVSVPSHCALMKPAAEALADMLASIPLHTPKIPIIHNATVSQLQHPDDIRAVLVAQLYSPVRWVETIQTMAQEAVKVFIECGPGKVLTGLNKRITDKVITYPTQSMVDLTQALNVVNTL